MKLVNFFIVYYTSKNKGPSTLLEKTHLRGCVVSDVDLFEELASE
jgi:hypothetical protein